MERLETERLILRRPRYDDARAIFDRYASDGEVTHYLSWRRHHSIEDAEVFVSFSDSEWTRWGCGPYLAFSRADGPKTYVQHQVTAQKERVWSLIEQGAIVYVCGDGGKMEPDVKAALVAIYREKTGADADAGLRWIEDLGTKNRYVLDVWAGG